VEDDATPLRILPNFPNIVGNSHRFALMRVIRSGVALAILLCFLLPAWGRQDRALAAGPDPTPTAHPMPPVRDRLAPPEMPAHPGQADLGAEVYYKVCMACHGDQGQGLTDELRSLLGPQDANCWQSKCHAANHAPGGFVFPKVVPAVVTPAMATRFPSALALHDFIQTNMPFNKPGGLSDDEYWQLTAYLVRANGGGPLPATLDAANAVSVPLKPAATGAPPPWLIALVVVVLVYAGVAAWWASRRSRTSTRRPR
jgi:hypothetical protein